MIVKFRYLIPLVLLGLVGGVALARYLYYLAVVLLIGWACVHHGGC